MVVRVFNVGLTAFGVILVVLGITRRSGSLFVRRIDGDWRVVAIAARSPLNEPTLVS